MSKEQLEKEGLITRKIFSDSSLFNKSSFKIFRYLLVVILLGVLLLLMGDFSTREIEPKQNTDQKLETEVSYESEIEERLEYSLSQIKGAGEVRVEITFASSSEYIYARNTQQNLNRSKSETGDLKSLQEDLRKEIVVLKKRGDDQALLKKEIKPEIKGILVIADGANSSVVKARLIEAIRTGLGIASHKIAVLPRER